MRDINEDKLLLKSFREDGLLLGALRDGLACAFLLAIVFLFPDAGHSAGKSFFKVALESSWRNPGDLAAAWCSLKIILLCLGVILLTNAVSKLMEALDKEALAVAASFAAVAPYLGLPFGCYQLLKALL
jgi:hypothetical protein